MGRSINSFIANGAESGGSGERFRGVRHEEGQGKKPVAIFNTISKRKRTKSTSETKLEMGKIDESETRGGGKKVHLSRDFRTVTSLIEGDDCRTRNRGCYRSKRKERKGK